MDEIGDYKPTNEAKMRRLRWIICRKELHDMLGLCSWMAPWIVSPNKSENYIGDDDMEGKVYRALTGRNTTAKQLDDAGFRAFTLHRAYTMREMNEVNMRKNHDFYPGWIFKDAKDRPAFTKGTIRMDKDDIEKSFDLLQADQLGSRHRRPDRTGLQGYQSRIRYPCHAERRFNPRKIEQ